MNETTSPIPHCIHQIWFQGSSVVPVKYSIFQETWKQEKDFEYAFWEERSIDSLMDSVPFSKWKTTYHSFPTMIQKIDFAKYVILYMHGGVYIDMDVFAVHSLKDFLREQHTKNLDFIVFQHNTPCITVTMNKMMGLEGSRIINNAVIFSAPENPKIKMIINACCDAQSGWKKNFLSLQLRCLVTTGPIVFTNCIRKIPNWKGFTFPADIFEPYTTLEMATLSTLYRDVAHNETVESCMHLISFLKTRKNMKNVVGVHVLDLNWFENGKNNWKFRAYRTLQKVKKGIISVGRQAHI